MATNTYSICPGCGSPYALPRGVVARCSCGARVIGGVRPGIARGLMVMLAAVIPAIGIIAAAAWAIIRFVR